MKTYEILSEPVESLRRCRSRRATSFVKATASRMPITLSTLVLTLVSATCSANSSVPTVADDEVVPVAHVDTITVVPDFVQLLQSDSVRFLASRSDPDRLSEHPNVVWRATGGLIDSHGMYFAATAPGEYYVIAETADGQRDTAEVKVVQETRAPTSVNVYPGESLLRFGETQTFTAEFRASTGVVVGVPTTWTAAGGVIIADGEYTAGSQWGEFQVHAEASNGISGSATVIVEPPVHSIEIDPQTLELGSSATYQMEARLFDAGGNILTSRGVSWHSSNPQIAEVSDTGLVFSTGVGTAYIVASAEGRSDSTRVVVEQGETVDLAGRFGRLARGINLTFWFSIGAWRPDYVSDQDLTQLANLGFSFVRLPVRAAELFDESSPSQLKAGIAEIERAVDMILATGMAVVVDFHPEIGGFKQRIIEDVGFADDVADFWEVLAQRLNGLDPERVFLEILNEPPEGDAIRWNAAVETLAEAVRRGAPEHTIIVGGSGCCGVEALAALEILPDQNIIYTTHFYAPGAFTHQGASWLASVSRLHDLPYPSGPEACAGVIETQPVEQRQEAIYYCDQSWSRQRLSGPIEAIADWAEQNGVYVLVGEFGVYKDYAPPTSRADYLLDARILFENYGLGWAMWDYDGGFGLMETVSSGVRHPDEAVAASLGLTGF